MFSTRYYLPMTEKPLTDLRALLDRVARLASADAWNAQLNPTQLAALDFLSRANRFSRAPSHVAEYLGATRGTVSQTLKSLERKGFVSETRSSTDKRRTSYAPTKTGLDALSGEQEILQALAEIPLPIRVQLEAGLRGVLSTLLNRRDGRAFGVCRTCRYHQTGADGAYCQLLETTLTAEETDQICQEHAA